MSGEKKGYLFLSNYNKPTEEQAKNRSPIKLNNFFAPCLKTALGMGYTVFFGVDRSNPEGIECDLPIRLYDSHTYRSIMAIKDNYIAYKKTCKLIKDENISVIHCNTPVGGMIGRICGKKCHADTVIYTVHGFHFYQGAPLINRTIYKWAEQIMAHWTDAIITMNREDFEAAKRLKLKKGGKVFLVHGVGIALSDFEGITNRQEKREELGLTSEDIALISAGNLMPSKNYQDAIRAIVKANNPHLQYFICGNGPEEEKLQNLAKEQGVEKQVHFLSFRNDVKELMAASDIFLFTTLREGLPRSMMEAMASGLPCIASKIRGNVDLIQDGVGGFLCPAKSIEAFADAIKKLAIDSALRDAMKKNNLQTIKKYDTEVIEREMREIYQEVLGISNV
jgi:glycosyltransferase involved in cell wall biosynthesis